MKIIDCVQGSYEWKLARVGVPTSSCFDNIITPKTHKASESASKYMARLLAEWLIGEPIDDGYSKFMDRGKDLEAEAKNRLAFDMDLNLVQVGFVTTNDGRAGCSPDSLVFDPERSEYVAGVEAKAPAAHTHAEYMLDPQSLANTYRCQIQGCLWVTGLPKWYAVSYNPTMGTVIVEVARDEVFIGKLAALVGAFNADLDKLKEANAAKRKFPRKPVERDEDPFAVNVPEMQTFTVEEIDEIARMMPDH